MELPRTYTSSITWNASVEAPVLHNFVKNNNKYIQKEFSRLASKCRTISSGVNTAYLQCAFGQDGFNFMLLVTRI